MCDDNKKKFIATLYNVLLAPDLCDRLFSIISLMNAGNICHFHKRFCSVYFGEEKDKSVTLPHSAVRNTILQGKSRICQRKINSQQKRKLN